MSQNFDQAKCDNTFWPRPNILTGSVVKIASTLPFFFSAGPNFVDDFSQQLLNVRLILLSKSIIHAEIQMPEFDIANSQPF